MSILCLKMVYPNLKLTEKSIASGFGASTLTVSTVLAFYYSNLGNSDTVRPLYCAPLYCADLYTARFFSPNLVPPTISKKILCSLFKPLQTWLEDFIPHEMYLRTSYYSFNWFKVVQILNEARKLPYKCSKYFAANISDTSILRGPLYCADFFVESTTPNYRAV